MSDKLERDQATSGQSAVDEEARPLQDALEETEGLLMLVAAMGQLAFQMLLGNIRGQGDQQEIQPAFDVYADMPPLEDFDDVEEKHEKDVYREERKAEGFSECIVLDEKTGCRVGSFSHDVMAPKSLSLPTEEELPHYDKSAEEAEEVGGKEEEEVNKPEDVEEGSKKHL